MIRLDGTWQPQATQLPQHLAVETRRIEADFRLQSPHRPHEPEPAPGSPVNVASAEVQIGLVLRQLADERSGPIAVVRGFVEHAALRLAGIPGTYGSEAGQRLELTARRLHALQRDLDVTASTLSRTGRTTLPSPGVAADPPTSPAYRSR
ncbi:hypothetical protein [Streptomyces sp. NPDC020965]|uniref:hypothetical protein n=1 Tax=Streptomyces sp. NPDC020965 TaxID=3365105 RepID=UPI003798A2FE